jgi:hypothetical protein
MPRKARIDAPGALHHIVIQGIERKPAFKDSQDYQNVNERPANILMSSNFRLRSFSKIHLLILV